MPLLVTAAVIIAGGKVLITRRPDDKRHPGFWEFPGGKVDPGESPEQALTREIQEELGAEIVIEQIFDVVYYCYDWGPVLVSEMSVKEIFIKQAFLRIPAPGARSAFWLASDLRRSGSGSPAAFSRPSNWDNHAI